MLPPRWLDPVADLFRRIARGERTYGIVACPPQHGKTEVNLHGLIWLLARRPWMRVAFVSYNEERALKVARDCRRVAKEVGMPLSDDSRKLNYWTLQTGGTVKWVGIGGGLTGDPVDLLITDDTIKGRQEAESPTQREQRWDWYQAVALSRLSENASVIHVETRWHIDDITGRMLQSAKSDPMAMQWEYVRLPAVNDAGEPLAPAVHSADALERRKATISAYEWASLYLGDPRPRGQELFGPPTFYETLPTGLSMRYAIGVDLAYSAKTRADYSVALVLAKDSNGTHYVVHVARRQCKATDFAATLRQLQHDYPGATMRWEAGGTEKGSADFLIASGIRLQVEQPRGDKFVRAQDAAAAWQHGRLLVPRQAQWLQSFTDEVCAFTGAGDLHDDQVDALSSAFAALQTGNHFVMSAQRDDLAGFGHW